MENTSTPPAVRLVPWGPDDLALLHAANAPGMMAHLGGPETEEKVLRRHQRYVGLSAVPDAEADGRMYRVVTPEGDSAGLIGYWDRGDEAPAYETGWSVLPAFQGRGIAGAAARAVIERARAQGRHRHLHAFPRVGNAASNAVCRKAGFTLLGQVEVDFPKGSFHLSNDWRFDLHPGPGDPAGGPAASLGEPG
ncbi:GNAT family N-acetyltransferase [Streptomyces yaizuensis]|uniref:GNAT family N-acetyltransferase n=1 Tax=Streptomyces yaizuensis TaxID=2989713 RepID=A0ABQ5P592_9ACTN|nr:GNAT family N-acetyltransferase [Streptomyces sp. YSPA8]GLF97431.1 GNAT family N-acetyltransferase [Streptomyces sp. YSPA8]